MGCRKKHRSVHASTVPSTVAAYVRWWTRYWEVEAPKVKIDQRMLDRYRAKGLYIPSSRTIVMGSKKLRGIDDVRTLEVELRHHTNPIERHEGE